MGWNPTIPEEMRDGVARSRRLARKLEREGRVREAHDLDRFTSFVIGWVTGHAQAEAKYVEEVAS